MPLLEILVHELRRISIFRLFFRKFHVISVRGSSRQLIAYNSFSVMISWVEYCGSFTMNIHVSTRMYRASEGPEKGNIPDINESGKNVIDADGSRKLRVLSPGACHRSFVCSV